MSAFILGASMIRLTMFSIVSAYPLLESLRRIGSRLLILYTWFLPPAAGITGTSGQLTALKRFVSARKVTKPASIQALHLQRPTRTKICTTRLPMTWARSKSLRSLTAHSQSTRQNPTFSWPAIWPASHDQKHFDRHGHMLQIVLVIQSADMKSLSCSDERRWAKCHLSVCLTAMHHCWSTRRDATLTIG